MSAFIFSALLLLPLLLFLLLLLLLLPASPWSTAFFGVRVRVAVTAGTGGGLRWFINPGPRATLVTQAKDCCFLLVSVAPSR